VVDPALHRVQHRLVAEQPSWRDPVVGDPAVQRAALAQRAGIVDS
jgi:hypothetical protein